MRTIWPALAVAVAAGCAWVPAVRWIDGAPAAEFRDLLTGQDRGQALRAQPGLSQASQNVSITYFGSGGLLIERIRGDSRDVIVTAPFFSHSSYLTLAFWKVGPRREPAATWLDPHRDALRQARAVLVGHAHYDHLLDLPAVVPAFSPAATIYGSETVSGLLRASFAGAKVQSLGGTEQTASTPGSWTVVKGGRIRFMAIRSSHAPNLAGITIAKGRTETGLVRLPRKAGGWKLGDTYAYMIDFLDEGCADPAGQPCQGQIAFRIYYQDAAHPPEKFHNLSGNPTAGTRRPDLAVLCVASSGEIDDYAESVKREIAAAHYLLAHWENFWRPYTTELSGLRVVPFNNPRRFIGQLVGADPAGASWVMPLPGTTLRW